MKVIFLDFGGVLYTAHHDSDENIKEKIGILAKICQDNNCKVVIISLDRDLIDVNSLTSPYEFINTILVALKEKKVECVGKTSPVIKNDENKHSSKIEEINMYLEMHPEIESFCIICDDLSLGNVEDDKYNLYGHLIRTVNYSRYDWFEGLLRSHGEEVRRIMKMENRAKKLALKKQ